jgi:hypothetical protein
MYRSRFIGKAGAVLAATLAIAPAAQANTNTPDNWDNRPAPNAMLGSQPQLLPDDSANRPAPSALTTSPAIVVRPASASGFDWGDAAIGAAATLGFTLAAGGAAAGLRSRRRELTV